MELCTSIIISQDNQRFHQTPTSFVVEPHTFDPHRSLSEWSFCCIPLASLHRCVQTQQLIQLVQMFGTRKIKGHDEREHKGNSCCQIE